MSTDNSGTSQKGKRRRYPTYVALFCVGVLVTGVLLSVLTRPGSNPVPPINPTPPPGTPLIYPYLLVPGDTTLDFPAAEGRLPHMDNDTWFLEGVLEGQDSGRRFSFIVVYFASRIYGWFPFNFYSLTFYDLDKAEYGTYTSYDFGRMNASTGYLNLSLPVNGQEALWTTALDHKGYLIPFSYHVDLPGVDQNGRNMSLVAEVSATNPPVAVGADTYNGRITVLKQADTYSYFQTGIEFDGVLTWGDYREPVKGSLGHIDRQMFPRFSGATNSRDGRNLSHEWRTYFLENGMDFSSWRQFDRTDKNSEYSFGGATTYDAINGARYAGDIVYENLSYVRTENHPVAPLLPPRSEVLYFPNRHRLSSALLELELEAKPIVNAPLLAFPVEYMHGPVLLHGTLQGQPIKGIGSFELTLHLYRDFELVSVLSDSVRHLPAGALLPATTPLKAMLDSITLTGNAVDDKDLALARENAHGPLRDQLQTLAEPYRSGMLLILDDLIAVIDKDS